jgi:hypothetical protein
MALGFFKKWIGPAKFKIKPVISPMIKHPDKGPDNIDLNKKLGGGPKFFESVLPRPSVQLLGQ